MSDLYHRQVLLIPAEEGGFIVEVPSLPGCISEGDTYEEAMANIREAIELHIEAMLAHNEPVPEEFPQLIMVSQV